MTAIPLFVAVFLACVVEAVEATTIVVAAGASRDWRSALTGTVAAVVVLAVAVAVLGPAIMALPLSVLRVVVGGLLLVFGLQWLRKAILRATGIKALHDEDAIYARQIDAARAATVQRRAGVPDWYAFTLSFKGVLLEGLEVVFIVLTFATNQGNLPVAVVGAGAAIVLVVILGAVVRGPLSRVPENTLKFIVGIMLTGFGAFWGAEGAGAVWPGADAALLVVVPGVAVCCLALTWAVAHRRHAVQRRRTVPVHASPAETAPQATAGPEDAAAPPVPPASGARRPRRLAAFGAFWYDFIVGDDPWVAAGVVVVLALTALLHFSSLAWIVMPIGLAALMVYGTLRAARHGLSAHPG